jgi:choice-of-anchor A domain-containing protein
MDPASNYGQWDHTGMATISHTTGQRTAGYAFTAPGVNTTNGLFGKGNGMGALAAMCDKAPLEVGGRVWNDANGSGIQDAGETALPNISVNLLSSAGTVVASAVSDAKGLYSFSNKAATSTTSSIYGIASLTPDSTGWKVQAILTDPDLPGGLFPTSQGVASDDASDLSRSSVIGIDGKSEAFAVGSSSFINQALGIGFRSVLADCTTSSIGRSINRSLLVSGSATISGLSTTGSVAVGGAITMTGGSIATGLPVDATRIDLAGNNNVTMSGVNLARGNYSYANAKTASGVTTAGSVAPLNQSAPWIASAFTTAQTASTFWAAQTMPATSNVTVTDSTVANKTFKFAGTLTSVNVFSISAANLQAAKHIDIDIPKGSLAVVNVTGGSSFTTAGWADVRYVGASAADPADARSGLSWNFVGITSITMSGAGVEGLFLAPSATLTAAGSTLKGSVVVSSMTSAGTIQFAPSKLSCLTPPTTTVLTATTTAPALPATCEPGLWIFRLTGAPTPPNTVRITWADGSTRDVVVFSTDSSNTSLYRTTANLDKAVIGASMVPPAGWTGTFALFQGPCKGPAPTLRACLEGAIGTVGVSGKFGYQVSKAVRSDATFINTVAPTGAAPFATMAVDSKFKMSAPIDLAAGAPTTWSVSGTYSSGESFATISATLPAAGTIVSDSNACVVSDTLFPT